LRSERKRGGGDAPLVSGEQPGRRHLLANESSAVSVGSWSRV
jgi:hypothetical protein